MATTTKKGSKNTKAKPRRPVVKTSPAKHAQTIAELRQELEASHRELTEAREQQIATAKELLEALEHQTATAEVLGIISRSPTDVQPVLDAIVESAARVCGIDDVVLRLREGNSMVPRAHFGPIPIARAEISTDEPNVRWVREHGTLHIPDASRKTISQGRIHRKLADLLSVPLRLQGELIGVLAARRIEVHPFTLAQIKLLETFADQAVIAIENVRLFQELKESLEQQTATSEILGVIASSPTDIQPVLDTVAKNATHVCGAWDSSVFMVVEGDQLRKVAGFGTGPGSPVGFQTPLDRGSPSGRAVIDRQTIHIDDIKAEVDIEFPQSKEMQERTGARTILATPLIREGDPIGVIVIRRTEVRPFADKQIKLLETFADQAVIAIENVRLFKELKSATQNCARRWNIRRRPPRYSASSAARPPTCSRSLTPSSRARRGFVGSMMLSLRLR